MKKNLFFPKMAYVLLPAILFTGELLTAQSDPGVDSELHQALERLDAAINSFETSIKYTAPEEALEIEAGYALERLEEFMAEAEKELSYEAPLYSDDAFDIFNTKDVHGAPLEYLTEIPLVNIWLNSF